MVAPTMTRSGFTIALTVAVLGWLVGCGGPRSQPGQAPPGGGGPPGAASAAGPSKPGSKPLVPKPASGEPAGSCDFRVGETCYATDTEACTAAGCKAGGCIVLESYPAQVTCK
jgi:hypothetical protein